MAHSCATSDSGASKSFKLSGLSVWSELARVPLCLGYSNRYGEEALYHLINFLTNVLSLITGSG